MKKIWKKLCVCLLVLVSSISFFACKEEDKDLSVDLDGDGKIAVWETLYKNEEKLGREIYEKNVIEISSFSQLEAISKQEDNVSKVYKLVKNINCQGKEVAINLKKSKLYGNNKYITNFKLGDIPDGQDKSIIKGLFYNGIGVYDLRVFVGKQSYVFTEFRQAIVAPFLNTENISDVEVKGYIDITIKDAMYASCETETSLCAGDISILGELASVEDNTGNAILDQHVRTMSNVKVIGRLNVKEEYGHDILSNVGGVISRVNENANIYNCTSDIDVDVVSSKEMNVGMIVGQNEGFVSTATANGNLRTSYAPADSGFYIGGICGKNKENGELKNCYTDAQISFNYDEMTGSTPTFSVGGIVGANYSGVVDYAISDAQIIISNLNSVVAGGICGISEYGIFDNIISRGSITLNGIKYIEVANMVGISRYGYMKSCIVDTPININNVGIGNMGSVDIGALTIFDEGASKNSNSIYSYNAHLSPHFNGVVLMGENIVNVDNVDVVNVELGLYNKYLKYIEPQEPSVSEDESEEELGPQYETKLPLIFDNVCIVKADDTEKNYRRYKTNCIVGGETFIFQDGLKNEAGTAFDINPVEPSSAVVMKTLTTSNFVSFCVNELDFKYGAGFNELAIPTNKVSDMKFTLSDEKAKVGYFNKNTKNNEYSDFDKFIDVNSEFDLDASGNLVFKDSSASNKEVTDKTKNYLTSDKEELLSYLIYLVDKGKEANSPIVISRKYLEAIYYCNFDLEGEDDSEGESGIPTPEPNPSPSPNPQPDEKEKVSNADLIAALEKHILLRLREYLANPLSPEDVKESQRLNLYLENPDESGGVTSLTKYLLFKLPTSKQTYKFLFDITYMMNADASSDYFVLYVSFK